MWKAARTMKTHEYPAAVMEEILFQKKDGFHLLDVDLWDFPLSNQYLLTFEKEFDPAKTVRVVNLEDFYFDHRVVHNGMVEMSASRFRHVARVLEEKEAGKHAAV